MKIRLFLAAVSLILICPPGLRAESAKPAGKPERPETELEKTMSTMGKAWRQVRKEARDGQFTPATAKLVATIRANAEVAAKLTPMLEAERPAAERAKFHAAFVAQIKKLIGTLAKLESALQAGDTSAATKLVAEVNGVMKAGHEDFRKPDED